MTRAIVLLLLDLRGNLYASFITVGVQVRAMKLVRCTLASDNWQNIVSGLERVAAGMTLWEIHDLSPGSTLAGCYRGRHFEIPSSAFVVEILTDESWLEDVLKAVAKGQYLQIFPVESSHHIRDGFIDI